MCAGCPRSAGTSDSLRSGVWSFLDVLGARPPAARWLGALARRQTPILAVFAEGDDGLQYLQDRTARAWRRARVRVD